MGLLDDAIREHLDLKRRRGADPGEIEQAEREALGPPRRDAFEQVADEPSGQVATDVAFDDEFAGEAIEGDPGTEPPAEDWGDVFEDEHAPAALPEEPMPLESEMVEDELPPEPTGPTPHRADAFVGEETAEYDVEAALDAEDENEEHHEPPAPEPAGAEPPPEEGDVLEETPEFLQDTPDHDRLWFEQRPPRDFDFDG